MTPESFPRRRIKSSSRHTAKRKRPPRSFVDERKGELGGYRGSSMRQMFAFRRSLRFIALAMCSASIVVLVTPASARPHHGAGRHARAYHAGHHAKRHYTHHHHRHTKRLSRWERGVARMQAGGFADTKRKLFTGPKPRSECNPDAARRHDGASGFDSSNVVAEARRHLGGNPTGRGSLWCARFTNGSAAFRLSRHRLGHGEFVCEIRPARFRAAGRRDRGDDAWPPRRSCRHHHRHRCYQEIRS